MTVKFLIIRFSSIGDIVLTTPVIRNLKNQVEGSEIHYLTKKRFSTIVENNVFVDKVHILQDSFRATIKNLRNEKFDYIIDLHKNLRSNRVKFQLRVLSFNFNKLNYQKWVLVNFKKNMLPQLHIVDRYLDTIRLFIDKPDSKGLDYFIPDGDEVNISSLPGEFQGDYVGWAIGAKHNTKKFPKLKIVEIINEIDIPVILLGGPEDNGDGDFIAKKTHTPVLNYCGRGNLNQSASLIRQAKLIITNDTGLMHIAAAFNKNIISLWGNTVPSFGMYPYVVEKQSVIIENNNLACRPCSKIGFQKCPKSHFKCMNDLNNRTIIDNIRNFYQF